MARIEVLGNLSTRLLLFSSSCEVGMDNDERIRFWEDVWIGIPFYVLRSPVFMDSLALTMFLSIV